MDLIVVDVATKFVKEYSEVSYDESDRKEDGEDWE